MLPLPMSHECPTCNRVFVSWRSLDSHLRLDHLTDEDEALTVAEILEGSLEDTPPEPSERAQPSSASGKPMLERAQALAAQPWTVGTVTWLGALYGLSHLGFTVGDLLLFSFIGAVVAGVVAVQAWARSELRLQEDTRRQNPPLI